MIFLIVPVHWDLIHIDFECREATSFEATSEPLLLILSKPRYLERYLSVDNKLNLNQSTQRLLLGLPESKYSETITRVKLFSFEHVVFISYVKKSLFLTLRKFLTFSVFHF